MAIALVILPLSVVPRWWCGRIAEPWFAGRSADDYASLAGAVTDWLDQRRFGQEFQTGSWQFDGEWLLGTWQMAGIGLGQLIERYPATRAQYGPHLRACAEALLSPPVRAFDARSWNGEDPLVSLSGPNGHVAVLGYGGVVLALDRSIDPATPLAATTSAIIAALVRRYQASPIGLLETYPGETYPVDNTTAMAAISIYDKATDNRHRELLASLTANFARRCVDPATDLVIQAVDSRTGAAVDRPRASGTALAAFFLARVDPALSARLLAGLRRHCAASAFGITAMREYPAGSPPGRSDIDSGPLIFGLSMSGTGFAIGPAAFHRDRELFTGLVRMGELCGSPWERDGRRGYALGGPLGNAIMLAMVTAGARP